MNKICKAKNCNKKLYAKGYCRTHYARLQRNGSLKRTSCINHGKICKAPNCVRSAYVSGYCSLHYYRWQKHKNLKKPSNLGKNNSNWQGGTSEYPNHTLMKKNRLVILIHNPNCEICGKKATQIHHKDFSKTNHQLNNLQALCRKCHYWIHSDRRNSTSKYLRKYGITLREMVNRYGWNCSRYMTLHKRGKLRKFLKEASDETK